MNDKEAIKRILGHIVDNLSPASRPQPTVKPPPNELKVYALFSSKDVRWNNETMHLALIPAYALEDAADEVRNILVAVGKNHGEWRIAEAAVYEYWKNLGPKQIFSISIPEARESKKEKSIKELSMYVRYVFANANDDDKKTAERVLADFEKAQS